MIQHSTYYQVQEQDPATGYWHIKGHFGDVVTTVVEDVAHWCKWFRRWAWITKEEKRTVVVDKRSDEDIRRRASGCAQSTFKGRKWSTKIVCKYETDFGDDTDWNYKDTTVVWLDGKWLVGEIGRLKLS